MKPNTKEQTTAEKNVDRTPPIDEATETRPICPVLGYTDYMCYNRE